MQTVELVGRLLISLAVVIGLIWLVARRMRGGRRRSMHTDKLIDVLGRQSLSRASSVAVVRVADRALIVGVTDSAVRVLGEIELDAVQAKLAELDPTTRRGSTRRADTPRSTTRRSPAHDGDPLGPAEESEFARLTAGLAGPDETIPTGPARPGGPLTGSALSPATWRQTLDALRDLTARKG